MALICLSHLGFICADYVPILFSSRQCHDKGRNLFSITPKIGGMISKIRIRPHVKTRQLNCRQSTFISFPQLQSFVQIKKNGLSPAAQWASGIVQAIHDGQIRLGDRLPSNQNPAYSEACKKLQAIGVLSSGRDFRVMKRPEFEWANEIRRFEPNFYQRILSPDDFFGETKATETLPLPPPIQSLLHFQRALAFGRIRVGDRLPSKYGRYMDNSHHFFYGELEKNGLVEYRGNGIALVTFSGMRDPIPRDKVTLLRDIVTLATFLGFSSREIIKVIHHFPSWVRELNGSEEALTQMESFFTKSRTRPPRVAFRKPMIISEDDLLDGFHFSSTDVPAPFPLMAHIVKLIDMNRLIPLDELPPVFEIANRLGVPWEMIDSAFKALSKIGLLFHERHRPYLVHSNLTTGWKDRLACRDLKLVAHEISIDGFKSLVPLDAEGTFPLDTQVLLGIVRGLNTGVFHRFHRLSNMDNLGRNTVTCRTIITRGYEMAYALGFLDTVSGQRRRFVITKDKAPDPLQRNTQQLLEDMILSCYYLGMEVDEIDHWVSGLPNRIIQSEEGQSLQERRYAHFVAA